ncbi:hypothetical protein GPECTOR_3g421 [Gonium pectorale]|uniref:SET domain-containing protein n=1 Tax=Gonium pectorale TaxID=33097 RepID=A0A150GZP3_GONPE|nr:hypothetical protein GPECTOR_3g421 [Gonium pectorale]|eukprot:KXZ55285.1 hypothetical protein GPECTOR_3g421 [Gonium pectorale]
MALLLNSATEPEPTLAYYAEAVLRHLENKLSGVACEHCLRFVGTVEVQIGHKLHSLVEQLRGAQEGGQGGGEEGSESGGSVDLEGALEAGERLEQIYSHVSPERIQALLSRSESLPLSDRFPLPQPLPCRRRCGALYCGATCEEAAWEHSHCLLCTGGAADASAASGAGPSTSGQGAGTSSDASGADGSGPSSSQPVPAPAAAGAGPSTPATAAAAAEEELYGIRVDRRALAAFVDHAAATNEIFLLAAKVVAATMLAAARALAAAAPGSEAAGADDAGAAASGSGSAGGAARSALLAAWRPFQHGWKKCWWDAVAVPEDVEDEEEFRGQLRSLASDSLELLAAALRDPRFGPEVLQLEVYGSIVGMFELNNLGLGVSTPVEDYFLALDEMGEGPEREAAMAVTQPLLDALDAEYATGAEATAFMALQSCINHSCDPNCTAACEGPDATVSVVAQRPIAAGTEITLSYIDVSLPYKARQAELADYGFVCRCERCAAEAAAARARRGGAGGKGLRVGGGGRRR